MIPAEMEASTRRLFHAERWPVATIARELHVHHSAVRRALRRDAVPLPALRTRRSKVNPTSASSPKR